MTITEKKQLIEFCTTNKWYADKNILNYLETVTVQEEVKEKRTLKQNNSLYKFLTLVADACIERGVTMRQIYEKTTDFDVPPTKERMHDVWAWFQKNLYKTESTTELETGQVSKVHEVMMKNLGELFGVEYIDWPHNPNGIPLSTREDPAFDKYYPKDGEDAEVHFD